MGHVFCLSNFIKAYRYLKKNGVRAAVSAVQERILQDGMSGWRYQPPAKEILEAQRRESVREGERPVLFSIAVPAFQTNLIYLGELLDSLEEQTYPYWELLLADAGGDGDVKEAVMSRGDERIRYIRLKSNEGISGNTNAAIRLAKGTYIGFLDHDDVLAPDALYEMARAIEQKVREGIRPVYLYSDEDKWDGQGSFYEPHLKMDFNLDLLLSNNYVCHFLVMDAGLMKSLLFRSGFDGAQDYDLVLRASAGVLHGTPEAAYVHIPRVLYHWRCHRDSTASNPASKTYAYEAGRRALEDFAKGQGWNVRVKDTRHLGFYRMEFIPDVLSQRGDVAAVAGPLPSRRGKLLSGIYEKKTDGTQESVEMRFHGLHRSFSGYLHRAVLLQDVDIADVRTMQVQPQWEHELNEGLRQIRGGADPIQVAQNFSKKLRKQGFRILWDPCGKEGIH